MPGFDIKQMTKSELLEDWASLTQSLALLSKNHTLSSGNINLRRRELRRELQLIEKQMRRKRIAFTSVLSPSKFDITYANFTNKLIRRAAERELALKAKKRSKAVARRR
jgi:hypothetical protein